MSGSNRRLRNKAGYLELHKGGKTWKKYLFKVTASTYFHYFGQSDASKAKEEILLVKIKSVDLPAKMHKGGMLHVFEVKFSGKGSPWVLNAPSEEEQMLWMEAILPGSSAIVTQFSQKAQLSPPVTSGRTSPMHQPTMAIDRSPSPLPERRNASGYHIAAQPNQGVKTIPASPQGPPTFPSPPHGVQPMSGYSPGVQTMPGYSPGVQAMPGSPQGVQVMPGYSQEVQAMPVNSHATPPAGSGHYPPGQFHTGPSPGVLANPAGGQVSPEFTSGAQTNAGGLSQERKQSSAGRRKKDPSSPEAGKSCDEFRPPQNSNPYVAEPYLDPAVLNQPITPTHNTSKPCIRPRQAMSLHDASTSHRPHVRDPTASVPASMAASERIVPVVMRRSATEKLASNLDSCVRTPIVPPRPKETLPAGSEDYTDMSGDSIPGKAEKPVPAKREAKGQYMLLEAPVPDEEPEYMYREMAEFLSNQFTPDQLGLLRGMLERMRAFDEGSLGGSSGAGMRSIGYVMSKTAQNVKETMLVTDDDDPDSYDQRPLWAKAVFDESTPNDEEYDDLEGGLCSLEQGVYSIPAMALSDMIRIGAGQFGEVFRANYCPDDGGEQESVSVAVKKTKDDCPEKEKESLLQEMAVMSKMVHPNIVKLYGVVTEGVPAPWVVLEYLPHGDLRNYLVTHGGKTHDQLVKYMVDVAMGMHYLAERNLVHRDLAARNVLVGEGELCKVADFGLMRELPKDDSIYQSTSNTPCPIRWMAPECIIHRQYSLASDVWAFGILQWEMFNPTKKMPYPGIDNMQVVIKVTKENYRMPLPRGCPSIVARVMKACWHSDPRRRPSFRLITTLLTTKGLRSRSAASKPQAPQTPEMYI